jgi:DNA ligase 1
MGSFSDFATVLEQVRGTTGKNEKVKSLAAFLRTLEPEEVEFVARFATGRASLKGSVDETQMGYSTIMEALRELTGLKPAEVSRIYLRHGDLGEVVEEALSEKKETTLFQDESLSVKEVAETFDAMTRAKGKGSTSLKRSYLKALLFRANPVEAKYVVKILTKEMRIGLVDGLVEEAIAQAYDLDGKAVREAHLLLGDIGLLARQAQSGGISGVRLELMRPTNFMLAEPMQTAEAIASYFGGNELYAEYKYDGVRAQIHKRGSEVKIFSRRLEEITASFPELVKAAGEIGHSFIADGEIVPFKDGRPLSFQLLQRRLRRLDAVEEARSGAPVRYFCFDLLLLDGVDIYRLPLRERREAMAGLIHGSTFMSAEMAKVTTAGEVEGRFRESRSLGYEGLVLKDPGSPYTPGKRGKSWVKLKEELDTLDVVIVAAELGHGKRVGKISDYTFAVRDVDTGGLKVIGKAYSGLTDKEIDEIMEKIKALTIEDEGYRRSVRPEIVLEVAFDSIQRSERHDSGFALRFPRIKRVRYDRSADQVDTMERVAQIYEAQKVKVDSGEGGGG